MKKFKIFFEQFTNHSTVGLLPGGFKPPTKGHFLALRELLKTCDSGVVFIGKSPRDGIDQDIAYQIWSIYAPYVGKPIQIFKAPVTPVKSVYDYCDDPANKNKIVIVGAGAKDNDIERYKYFTKNQERYPNVFINKINIQGEGISGSQTREMILQKDPNVIDFFCPTELKETDKERIRVLLKIK